MRNYFASANLPGLGYSPEITTDQCECLHVNSAGTPSSSCPVWGHVHLTRWITRHVSSQFCMQCIGEEPSLNIAPHWFV